MAEGLEPSKRGIVAAWQTMSGTFGGSMGTVAGGMVISVMGWRYVFFLAMGPMAAMWLLSFCVLPEDSQVKNRADLKAKLATFDKTGTLLFIICSGCFLMALNRGNDLGWQSTTVLGFFGTHLQTRPLQVFALRCCDDQVLEM
jgi:MFS family permease